MFYGRQSNASDEPVIIRYQAIENSVERYRQQWYKALENAFTRYLIEAKMKKYNYDKCSKAVKINVGNYVLLNSSQSSSKFSDRWEGPYRVTKITSSENVELMNI